jgi:trimethylamine--corrinoid protein Co-methyltransferase
LRRRSGEIQMPEIKPIQPKLRLDVLTTEQLESIKSATLDIMENVGVHFPSERALYVFSDHGARIDWDTKIVRLRPELVMGAMRHAPRSFVLSGRADGTDLYLDRRTSYFGTDGCGTRTVDLETGVERRSCKDDVAKIARVADHLSSVSFYWPMVSAQTYGRLAPLHELDASFNNMVKHVQSETVMGEKPAQCAWQRLLLAIENGCERIHLSPC